MMKCTACVCTTGTNKFQWQKRFLETGMTAIKNTKFALFHLSHSIVLMFDLFLEQSSAAQKTLIVSAWVQDYLKIFNLFCSLKSKLLLSFSKCNI